MALGQCLRVRCHDGDAFQRVVAAQQVVANQHAHLAHDVARRIAEHVQRAVDHAFGGVFNAHNAILRAACSGGVEHFFKRVAVQKVCSAAEILHGCFFAESACRAEHRHALGRFQRQAGRHDLAPDGGHVRTLEWAGVVVLDFFDDLRHAIGAEERGAFFFLQLTHLLGHACALVHQLQQLVVQTVDLVAQLQQLRCGLGLSAHGFLEKQSC